MNTTIRMSKQLHEALLRDLSRPHPFAAERVAFCHARIGNRGGDPTLVFLTESWAVPDDQYLDDPDSGARINSTAIRNAMQSVLTSGQGVLHVHLHEHSGRPGFSPMDRREQPRLVESLKNTNSALPHGMLVLSRDSAAADIWLPGQPKLRSVHQISVVGWPTVMIRDESQPASGDRFSRQSFLGAHSSDIISSTRVGFVGLGGGGSHIAQQLAHLGFLNFVLIDPDCIEESNLNRLVGGTEWDVRAGVAKVHIAARLIGGIRRLAVVDPIQARWQEALSQLRSCDLVFGCVDGFDERRQLETTCRRYLIPYVDIGMDVHTVGNEPPRVAGQVIVSIPGMPCMQCLGFLNERVLAREAQRYGDAGDQPQVVWSNGVLASSAVGVAIDLLTNWARREPTPIYLSYDGNVGTVTPHPRLSFLPTTNCTHHPLADLGDPSF